MLRPGRSCTRRLTGAGESFETGNSVTVVVSKTSTTGTLASLVIGASDRLPGRAAGQTTYDAQQKVNQQHC